MIDLIAEYRAVREYVGIMDRSAAGALAILGSDRFSWLQGMVSNDVQLLAKGQTKRLQACILNATGHLLSDIALISIPAMHPLAEALGLKTDFVLMDLPGDNVGKIAAILDRFLITEDVEIRDISMQVRCLSLQGQAVFSTVNALITESYSGNGFYAVDADHTGSGGVDLYFAQPGAGELFSDTPTISTTTQELLRVEAGIPKYGVDMDESTIPLEANLGATHISLTKGCYVGQEIIARIDSRGHTNRALTGLLIEFGDIPQCGDTLYVVADEGDTGRETGRITSVVAASPVMGGQPIALGYVRHEHRVVGTWLRAENAGRATELSVVGFPSFLTGV